MEEYEGGEKKAFLRRWDYCRDAQKENLAW
jgi:hypothetical protein